jgi:hypothetical protein
MRPTTDQPTASRGIGDAQRLSSAITSLAGQRVPRTRHQLISLPSNASIEDRSSWCSLHVWRARWIRIVSTMNVACSVTPLRHTFRLVPVRDPRPDLRPPGPDSRRGPSRGGTGTASERHPPGVPQRDHLNPPIESPSEPSDAAAEILAAVTEAWKLGTREAHSLLGAVESALARGWSAVDLTERLVKSPDGVRDPVRVLARRLTDFAQLRGPRPLSVPWCGECEDAHSRTISVTEPDGTEVARFCPQCSPQVHRARPSGSASLQRTERW